eukprot:1147917-Pelagomonas_calceolata.AAC.5
MHVQTRLVTHQLFRLQIQHRAWAACAEEVCALAATLASHGCQKKKEISVQTAETLRAHQSRKRWHLGSKH